MLISNGCNSAAIALLSIANRHFSRSRKTYQAGTCDVAIIRTCHERSVSCRSLRWRTCHNSDPLRPRHLPYSRPSTALYLLKCLVPTARSQKSDPSIFFLLPESRFLDSSFPVSGLVVPESRFLDSSFRESQNRLPGSRWPAQWLTHF